MLTDLAEVLLYTARTLLAWLLIFAIAVGILVMLH